MAFTELVADARRGHQHHRSTQSPIARLRQADQSVTHLSQTAGSRLQSVLRLRCAGDEVFLSEGSYSLGERF